MCVMTAHTIPVSPFDYVVFGATGDLALRKLMPALAARDRDGQIPASSRIIAVSRSESDTEKYRALLNEKVTTIHGAALTQSAAWKTFVERVSFISIDASGTRGWDALASRLHERDDHIRVYYLAVAPELFVPITERLAQAQLNSANARIVLEKPIGHDATSAQKINDAVRAAFSEAQTYRIDHYLGKETVQNLFVLRFANALIEPLMNRQYVDHVQITVAEKVGLEGRHAYYDGAGAFRDMVQNHLMQLVCLTAMEPPQAFSADAIRDEKLKVLRALAPLTKNDFVRGQYVAAKGATEGETGYADELGKPSRTETFIALKLGIENWRWAGVPFYLRTGKRMPEKVSEIVIQLRSVPHNILPPDAGNVPANRLVLRLQPNEGVKLGLTVKEPGPGGMRVLPVDLDMSFAESFGVAQPEAYERLLMDVVRGNQTLFSRRDEVDAAWQWASPVSALFSSDMLHPYESASWGPVLAQQLLERAGRKWAQG
jgi:glucose-6-phosphate 1-dehydrogenase